MKYNYLIVGAGFFGATFARLATDAGKTCLVIDSRSHIGGNAYSEKIEGIDVHVYGPHIFHTNDDDIWAFVNRFTKFNNFVLNPKLQSKGKLYSLPFNMNTFYELWGCTKPEEAKAIIESQKLKLNRPPANLEEQALSMIGTDLYKLIVEDYTKKQWKKEPKDLPASIIKRLPIRFIFDNNYFDDKYQGIPVDGYGKLFERMLEGIEVRIEADYFKYKDMWDQLADKIVFTGKIDEYFDYEFGELEYRTLDFIHERLETDNAQGSAMINYPDSDVPWTRIVEHKHFTKAKTDFTIITKEIPAEWDKTKIPCYPINDEKNTAIYNKYREKADALENVIFGGRLTEYKYYDMHQVIGSAMATVKKHL
jgi:UDP-galactopyranose mutase